MAKVATKDDTPRIIPYIDGLMYLGMAGADIEPELASRQYRTHMHISKQTRKLGSFCGLVECCLVSHSLKLASYT